MRRAFLAALLSFLAACGGAIASDTYVISATVALVDGGEVSVWCLGSDTRVSGGCEAIGAGLLVLDAAEGADGWSCAGRKTGTGEASLRINLVCRGVEKP